MTSLSPEQSSSPLAGQFVVFTGKLMSLGRRDARELVARLGGTVADEVTVKTTMIVVGAEGFGASGKSQKLKRVEELNAQLAASIAIVAEEDFCRLAGVLTPSALKQQYSALRDLLARYRELREDHVRYLVKCGLIKPALRTNADTFFTFQDVATIRQANEEMVQGASFRSAVRTLMSSHQGQLVFDFRLDAARAKILTLSHKQETPKPSAVTASAPQYDPRLAEEYFHVASDLDDGEESTREQAASAYRKALELDPHLVAALINLANIHYSRDELVEAQALYERAIAIESDFFEAHFNLGNIYHDLGQYAEARSCYREALRLNPTYSDTHFYLAVTLEKMGLSHDARPHWRAYQHLAPQGEWVALAKEFSE